MTERLAVHSPQRTVEKCVPSVTKSETPQGGTELAAAERAGRELIARAPYRENGYRHLMQALSQTGNTGEALRVYEQLRTLLRDELGITPSPDTLKLHVELLRGATQQPAELHSPMGVQATGADSPLGR